MKGKFVLITFPFTDLSKTKVRPALILHEGNEDVIAAFISSSGIVFSSNTDDWMFQPVFPLGEKSLSELQKSKQFSDKLSSEKIKSIAQQIKPNQVRINSKNYYFEQDNIQIMSEFGSWKLFSLADKNKILPMHHFLFGSLVIMILFVLLNLNYFARIARKHAQNALRDAEEKIKKSNVHFNQLAEQS